MMAWAFLLGARFALAFSFCFMTDRSPDPPLSFEQDVIDGSGIAYERRVGDLDGDGQRDIVAINDTSLYWFVAPSWTRKNLLTLNEAIHGFPYFRDDDLRLADIDGDNDLDVVVRIGDSGDINGEVVWIENPLPTHPVSGTWTVHNVGSNQYTKDMAVVDVDRDGLLDIVSRENSRTQIWFQNSPTSWQKKEIVHDSHEGMDVGDLDDDGDVDIVLNGFWLQTPANPRSGTYAIRSIDAKWYSGQTDGYDWQHNNCKVAVADINADGHLDVVLSHSELPGYPVSWYSAVDPVSGPWTEHVIVPECDYCHNLQVRDFDGDGDADVLAGGMIQSDERGLTLYRGDGAGSTWAPLVIQQLGSYSAVVGDLEEDNDWDIVTVRQWDEAPTEIWRNTLAHLLDGDVNGDCVVNVTDLGILTAHYGATPVTREEGDLNGDDRVDIGDLGILMADFGTTCP